MTSDDSFVPEPILHHPFSMVVSGCSGSGKTFFVMNLLKELKFENNYSPSSLIINSSENVEQWNDLRSFFPIIYFKDNLNFDVPKDSLIVVDDNMMEAVESDMVSKLFTRKVHHLNVSVVLITQNLFPQGKHGRNIRLNTMYFVIFKSPAFQSQIQHLSRSLFPHQPRFVSAAYKSATKDPYSYLFLSLHPRTNDNLRVGSGILSKESLTIFLP